MKDKKYIAKVEFVEKAINDYKKDLIEKIEKIIEEERYSGAPIALNKLIKIIKEG